MSGCSTSAWCLKRRELSRWSMLRTLARSSLDDRAGGPGHLLAGVSTVVEEMPVLSSSEASSRDRRRGNHDGRFSPCRRTSPSRTGISWIACYAAWCGAAWKNSTMADWRLMTAASAGNSDGRAMTLWRPRSRFGTLASIDIWFSAAVSARQRRISADTGPATTWSAWCGSSAGMPRCRPVWKAARPVFSARLPGLPTG